MMRFLLVCAPLLLGGCATLSSVMDPAFTPSSPASDIVVHAPDWRAGSEWHYDDGFGLVVAKVEGQTTTFRRTDDSEQWVVRRGFLREDAQSRTALRKLMFEGLPPGAGLILSGDKPVTYRREYMAGSVRRTHATSWTVEGRELAKVPAGEFDCVVLVMRTRNIEDGWTGFERWWFSPKAQNYVRMEYRYGDTPAGSRVLLDYRLGPSASGS